MKTKVTLILIICLFMAPGLAMSQNTGTKKSKDREAAEVYILNQKKYNLDSIIAPSLRIAGQAISGSGRALARDGYLQMFDYSRNSSLSFRKVFDEKKTLNRSYDMVFEKEHKILDIRISASAEEGSIQIVIVQPNGKNYKELELEGQESLTWNHAIKDYNDENKAEYSGTWEVKVSIKNAIGYYNVKMTVK